jgi:hypothetical protein
VGWATTFWAVYSQTRLVALLSTELIHSTFVDNAKEGPEIADGLLLIISCIIFN